MKKSKRIRTQCVLPFIPKGVTELAAVDNGLTGAFTILLRDGTWEAHPVVVQTERGRRMLDVFGNLKILKSFAQKAGGIDRVFVVYEQSGQNRTFGFRNSFVNGRNDEFWRVLLTLEGFQFASVHPNTWQTGCGIKDCTGKAPKGEDTKAKALKFVHKQCGRVEWLEKFTKPQQRGIVDAMCIALWLKRLRTKAK